MSDFPISVARERLASADSSWRAGVLVKLHDMLPYSDWLSLWAEFWGTFDRLGPWRLELRKLLPREGPVLEMMSPEELDAWHKLPPRVKLYRGCGPDNLLGLAWTQNHELASRYPLMDRYFQSLPLVSWAVAPKRRVLAVKQNGQHFDVITFDAKRKFFLCPNATTISAAVSAYACSRSRYR